MTQRKRILVVDDEEKNRELLEALLESLGYDSEMAGSGFEALAKLDSRIDLVLLDVMMPGMSGLEVAQQIRASQDFSDLPIIVVTVLQSKEDRLRAVEAGANDFIAKPIDKIELKVRVASLIRMKEAQDSIKRHRADLQTMVEQRTADLRESEARYRMLVENAPIGIVSCDLQGTILAVNSYMLAILGSPSVEETKAVNVLTFPPLVDSGLAEQVKQCMESGTPAIAEFPLAGKWSKGSFLRIHLAATRDFTGTINGAQAVVEDISERKRSQDALRASEERFRAIFETTQDCVFMKNRALEYSHANPAMLVLLELTKPEVVGRTDETVFGPDYAHQAKSLESRVLEGEIIETEQTLSYKDRSITFNFVRFPMRGPAGAIVGICGIARDVTERRQREIVPGEQADRYPSDAMRETLMQVRLAAKSESIVLFLGESGSGKDYLSRYLHESSNRAGGPFFTVNCAALAPELVESELFGHEPGAFTGSHGRKRGLLELAEGGTLLLNEIGELQPKLQSKLLTFLDTQTFIRVGGEKNVTVNARLIAATNRELEQEVKQGNFREDLFYRLNVFCIRVPPLRERREDLPFILDELLLNLSRQMGLGSVPRIDEPAMEILVNYRWPGNVREARNVLERALILCDRRKISAKDLSITEKSALKRLTADEFSLSLNLPLRASMHQTLLEAKRRLVEEALGRSNGSIKGAAILLGISRDSFVHHMKSLGVRR